MWVDIGHMVHPWSRYVAHVERYEDRHWPRPGWDALGVLGGTIVLVPYFVHHHNTWYFWVLLPVALVVIINRTWHVNRDRLRLKQLEKEMPWCDPAVRRGG
jgi:hypothetical protein